MGSGAGKEEKKGLDENEVDDYGDDDPGAERAQGNQTRANKNRANQQYRSQPKPAPQRRQPPQEEIGEEGEEGDDGEEEEKLPPPKANNRNNAGARNGGDPNYSGPRRGAATTTGGGGPKAYIMQKRAKKKTDDMHEDLPVFNQYVNAIKSPIPYPVDPEVPVRASLPEKYEFTKNSNVLDVFEEERLAVVPRSEALKPYMALKEVLNNEWVDDDFPPEKNKITEDPRIQQAELTKVIWKKISDLAPPQGFSIIYDTNKPNAIVPGKLDDKAFQSAISILAEKEAYLPSIFPEFNESSNAVLCIWLNNTGEWKIYVMDEFIPFDRERSNWAFTSSSNETWVLILEKAFAKMYGDYYTLELGHTAHYIHDITGAPYEYFYYDNPDECWNFLTSFDRSLTTLVAMNKDQRFCVQDDNDLERESSYSYAILDLQEVRTSKGVERLIKLRDPWPEKTWFGDWSHESKKWTPQVMNKLCPNGLTDDIFWININDFVKNYGYGFTFRIYPGYLHGSIRLTHSSERNYSLVLMHVQSPAHIFLQVNQPDQRYFLEYDDTYSYSLAKMMVVEVDSRLRPKRFVTGMFDKGRDCHVEYSFTTGDYLVYLELDWEQNLNREVVLSSYGQTNVVFYEANCLEEKMGLVRRFLTQYFKSFSNADETMDYGTFGDKRVKRYIEYIYGYLCFYYVNKSDIFALTEKVKMEPLYGLRITLPFTDDFEFDVNVKTNSEYMVVYKTDLDGQVRHYYKHMSWSYLFPDSSDEIVKKLTITKAKKIIKRRVHGKEVDILVYVYSFSGGYCFYYINKTRYIYRERLGIDLINLVGFDNGEQTYYEITLNPNQDYLLKFKVKDPLHPFSYVTHATYKINASKDDDEEGADQDEDQERGRGGGGGDQRKKGGNQGMGGHRGLGGGIGGGVGGSKRPVEKGKLVPKMVPQKVADMLTKEWEPSGDERLVQPLSYNYPQKPEPVKTDPLVTKIKNE